MSSILSNAVEIKIKYGHLKRVIEWCSLNCQGDYNFYQPDDQDISSPDYLYGFIFHDESDQLKFILRWAS